MSDSSERNPYPYEQSDEDHYDNDALADSGQDLNFRKSAASSGAVATASPLNPFHNMLLGPRDPPGLDSETSGESNPPTTWAGASKSTEPSRFVPSGKPYGSHAYAAPFAPPAAAHTYDPCGREPWYDHQQASYGGHIPQQHTQHRGHGPGSFVSPTQHMAAVSCLPAMELQESPGFFAPFGTAGTAATEWSPCAEEDPDTPRVRIFPSTFRLERTNFVAKLGLATLGRRISEGIEAVTTLLAALKKALWTVGVDVLDFKPAHCVLECSSHVGNRFLSIFIRIFQAPDRASGQLLETTADAYSKDNAHRGVEGDEENPFLVEAQLREGDRLHFSALFRDIMREFKKQEGMDIAGTFCYKRRTPPAMGEGLALEEANLKPARNCFRPLAVRKESGDGSSGRNAWAMEASSPPPVPASMAKISPENDDAFDEDMIEDVMVLIKMLRSTYLDVQADAAMAVAGLTADPGFLRQLCSDKAAQVASALCAASARLLVETRHRPARRQAAVVVANLSTDPWLRLALLASDPPVPAYGSARALAPDGYLHQRRLVDSLFMLSMGTHDGGDVGGAASNTKEEEIGMRRECMRALAGLAECEEVRDMRAMRLLLSLEPAGRGAKDSTLVERLSECRTVLKTRG